MRRVVFVLGAIIIVLSVCLLRVPSVNEQRLQDLQRRVDSLKVIAARVDTLYTTDTLRLWRQTRILDTLTVTVDQWKHDTVEVVRYVQRADSVVQACTAALQTCETRVAARDATIAAQDSMLTVQEQAAGRRALKAAGVAVVVWEGVKLLLRRP